MRDSAEIQAVIYAIENGDWDAADDIVPGGTDNNATIGGVVEALRWALEGEFEDGEGIEERMEQKARDAAERRTTSPGFDRFPTVEEVAEVGGADPDRLRRAVEGLGERVEDGEDR